MTFSIALVNGAVLGALFLLFAHAFRRHLRQVLAYGLIVAALVYVFFSLDAQTSNTWLFIELLGVAFYGALGLRAIRGSAWWLVAGWTLHPVWDIALHYVGPGRAFAPAWYSVPCLSWDLVVAGWIALRMTRSAGPATGARHALYEE